jgi:hypothetical protein
MAPSSPMGKFPCAQRNQGSIAPGSFQYQRIDNNNNQNLKMQANQAQTIQQKEPAVKKYK